MEPVANLKRTLDMSYDLCIISQEEVKGDTLRKASVTSLKTVREATSSRYKLHDIKYRDAIDRLQIALDSKHANSLLWHTKCYAQFTDKGKIKRLQASHTQTSATASRISDTGTSSKPEASTSGCKSGLRSHVQPFDKNKCMFCLDDTVKARLISVTSFNMSNKIITAASLHQTMSARLAGISDLMAAEGKYHLACLSAFNRTTSKTDEIRKVSDLPMAWLSEELKYAAEKGHVFKLSEVWTCYCNLAEESSTNIPQSYISCRHSFKEKLEKQIAGIYEFVHPIWLPTADRQLLLIPVKHSH